MESLVKPDFGLVFWTLVNFAILAVVLWKLAWKPIIKSIDAREEKIRADIETARASGARAEQIKTELEQKLAGIAEREKETIKTALELGEKEKEAIILRARREYGKIIDDGRREISAEKNQAIAEIKKYVADISLTAAQRLIGREIDDKTNEKVVASLLGELEKRNENG